MGHKTKNIFVSVVAIVALMVLAWFIFERSFVGKHAGALKGETAIGQWGDYVFKRDAIHVYVSSSLSDDAEYSVISEADPSSFEVLGGTSDLIGMYYAKDASHVFAGHGDAGCACVRSEVLQGVDASTFDVVWLKDDYAFVADNLHVFSGVEVLDGADRVSFLVRKATPEERECGVETIVSDKYRRYALIDPNGNSVSSVDFDACMR